MSAQTADQIRNSILRVLGNIAPEADTATLDPGMAFRDQLDLDSFDFLNFVIGVHEELGVDIPEADYPRLSSLDRAVAYIMAAIPAGAVPVEGSMPA
jgi:acyl carrier protein